MCDPVDDEPLTADVGFELQGGEGGDGSGQRLRLFAGLLMGAVEQVVEQGGVGGEEPAVERWGDLAECALDRGQGGGQRRAL